MKQKCAGCRLRIEQDRPLIDVSWFTVTITGFDLEAGETKPDESPIGTLMLCPHCFFRWMRQPDTTRTALVLDGVRQGILNSMRAELLDGKLENSNLKLEGGTPMTADGHPPRPPHEVEGSQNG